MDGSTLVLLLDLGFVGALWHFKNLADREPPNSLARFLFGAALGPGAGATRREVFGSAVALFVWGLVFLGMFFANAFPMSDSAIDYRLEVLFRVVTVVSGLFCLIGTLGALGFLVRGIFTASRRR